MEVAKNTKALIAKPETVEFRVINSRFLPRKKAFSASQKGL